jgi:hypothetical protein
VYAWLCSTGTLVSAVPWAMIWLMPTGKKSIGEAALQCQHNLWYRMTVLPFGYFYSIKEMPDR